MIWNPEQLDRAKTAMENKLKAIAADIVINGEKDGEFMLTMEE